MTNIAAFCVHDLRSALFTMFVNGTCCFLDEAKVRMYHKEEFNRHLTGADRLT